MVSKDENGGFKITFAVSISEEIFCFIKLKLTIIHFYIMQQQITKTVKSSFLALQNKAKHLIFIQNNFKN